MTAGLPRFDYSGALQLMADLYGAAEALEDASGPRARSRNVALDPGEFQGPYGDDHRSRGIAEDLQANNSIDAMRETAKLWANAWATAVNDANDAVYQEALRDQATHERYVQMQYFYDLERAEEGEYVRPPRLGEVDVPMTIATPAADGSGAETAPFIFYIRAGPSLRAIYNRAEPS